jgi:hypothetical protein
VIELCWWAEVRACGRSVNRAHGIKGGSRASWERDQRVCVCVMRDYTGPGAGRETGCCPCVAT